MSLGQFLQIYDGFVYSQERGQGEEDVIMILRINTAIEIYPQH